MEQHTFMFWALDSTDLGYAGGVANGGSRRPSGADRNWLAATGRLAGFPHRSHALWTDVTLTEFHHDALSTAQFVLGVGKGTQVMPSTPRADACLVAKTGHAALTEGFCFDCRPEV